MKNKKLFESVIILKGAFTEDEYRKALKSITERIKNIVDITKVDEVGKKKLAYEIKKNLTGWYVVLYYKCMSQDILELERLFRITDDIIKFITIRKAD